METETVYVLNVRPFRSERGQGRCMSDVSASADEAYWGFLGTAQKFADQAPQRSGDFLCEIYRHGGEKPVVTFRMQKTESCVVSHQPGCPCEGCHDLVRRGG